MRGDVTINGMDAFTEWGVNFEDGALSALMTPPPMKPYIESKSRLQHGISVLPGNARKDERELTLPFHLMAGSRQEFLDRYRRFCDDVLTNGIMEVETRYEPNKVYRLLYVTCTQFTQYRGELAIFALRVKEPNPNDREKR